jgi:ElaB/YqjD/DUF883 family membrane-anchored ribosome-binding protein
MAADSMEKLRSDVEALQTQLGKLLELAAKTGHDGARAARVEAAKLAESARDTATAYGREGYDAVNDVVQRHPLASLAGAALFGAIMARLLQSRH